MLSEKPWRLDALLRLCAGLFLSVGVGALLSSALRIYFGAAGTDTLNFCQFIISNLSFHGAALWLISIFLREHQIDWSTAFGFATAHRKRALRLAFLAALIVVPISWLLNLTSAWVMTSLHVEPVVQQAVQTLQTTESRGDRLYFAVIAIVVAPVVEELLFRGILYPTVKQSGYPRLALWGTALLFAATHYNVLTFVPLTFLALVLTWLYERSNNLAASMVTHGLFNAANFLWLVNVDLINRFLEKWVGPL